MIAKLGAGRGGLWLGLLVFALLVAAGWIGFLGSDDVTYARGAYGWLDHFPYVGGHGTIRYPITLPMALSFLALGGNSFAMVLPSLLYAIGFLVLVWVWVRRAGDAAMATAALFALATSPLIVIQSGIANVDAVEMFFLFASVYLTWRCLDEGPDAGRLFAAGALAGLAFLTRETAIFVALFYGLLFLAGHRFARWHYLWIACGFLAVWALELAYLGIMTGDPMYRFNISLHHDATIDRGVDLAGNTIVHPLVDPLLVLLLNQEFMALFWLAIPMGLWLCFARAIDARLQHFARIVALFGLVWFVCVGAAQKLLPLNPRYFMISCAAACMLTGIALVLLWRRKPLLAAGLAAALVGGNLVGIIVENKDSLFGERQYAAIVAAWGGEPVHTDPMTRYRADMLLKWNGGMARAKDAPPPAGALYLYNPANADRANFKMPAERMPAFKPGPGWRLLSRAEPAPSVLAVAIEGAGLRRLVPEGVWRKLRYRHPAVMLYRVAAPVPSGRGPAPDSPGSASR